MALINKTTTNSICHQQVWPQACILSNLFNRSSNGRKEISQLRNSPEVIKRSISKLHAFTSRWKRKKSALSNPKLTRKAADTLMCRIYSKDFTTIAKGDRSIWFLEKNKKLALRCNTVHSLHRQWFPRILVFKRQEISPKIKSMTNSTPTMIHSNERNLDSNMRGRKP